jgi:hypothetical protein
VENMGMIIALKSLKVYDNDSNFTKMHATIPKT